MRVKMALAAALLLAGCERETPRTPDTPGARLERAATSAGLIADPAAGTLTGSWSLDTDRACVVPGDGEDARESRLGLLVDYGEGQGCAASGTVRREGERLDVQLGDCRVRARFDGERITFPPETPAACQSLCTGRASLDSVTVERVSESRSEAATLRTPSGHRLCPD